MSRTRLTSRPRPAPAETRPPRAPRWSAVGLVCGLVLPVGLLGCLGLFAGSFAAGALDAPLLWGRIAGLLGGVAGGLGVAALLLHRAGGKKRRAGRGSLPAGGQALNERVAVLRDTLAHTLALRPSRQVQTLSGHTGSVLAVAVSPDGRSALSGGRDRTMRLWDLAGGFEVRAFTDFAGIVQAVAFSPDGRLAAAAERDPRPGRRHAVPGSVRVYDVESGRELRRFAVDGSAWSLAFLRRGARLLVGEEDLRLWDVAGGDLLAAVHLPSQLLSRQAVLAVAGSPDGRFALVGCRSTSEARLIDLEEGTCRCRFAGHGHWFTLFRRLPVTSVAFSADGERVLTGSLDQTARVWDVESGKETACFHGHRGRWGRHGVTGVAFLPDGERALSAGEDGTVRLWRTDSGKELMCYRHGRAVTCLARGQDGRLALSGGADGQVRLWCLPGS